VRRCREGGWCERVLAEEAEEVSCFFDVRWEVFVEHRWSGRKNRKQGGRQLPHGLRLNSDARSRKRLDLDWDGGAEIRSRHEGEVGIELLKQFAVVEAFPFSRVRTRSGFREPEGYLDGIEILLECEPMSDDCAELPDDSYGQQSGMIQAQVERDVNRRETALPMSKARHGLRRLLPDSRRAHQVKVGIIEKEDERREEIAWNLRVADGAGFRQN